MNTEEELQYLLRQYLNNDITEEEYQKLWKVLEASDKENILSDELLLLWEKARHDNPVFSANEWDDKMQRLLTVGGSENKAGKRPFWRAYKYYAAASILLLIASGIYFTLKKTTLQQPNNNQQTVLSVPDKIKPGGNKAVLTLANGSKVVLDSTSTGIISMQGNARITKSTNGKIVYHKLKSDPADVVYNSISTPRGGRYQITLSDGTKVWLNSASSLRFPSSFTGDKRIVEMTGEAYFEVAPHPVSSEGAIPFIVSVDGMRVNVLGTHFNIMAYDDEPLVKTTLITGRVSVEKGDQQVLLQPGQQANMGKTGAIHKIGNVNLDKIMAWKNNLFWFDKNTIDEVMRQVARWYDADVEIKGNIPQHFTGSIPRDVDVLRIFQILQETGNIQFQVKGHKIIVNP